MPGKLSVPLWNWWVWKKHTEHQRSLSGERGEGVGFMYVNLTHVQVKTCAFLISSWLNMLFHTCKKRSTSAIFYLVVRVLSAAITADRVYVVYLGPGLTYKGRRKCVPSVVKGRANLKFLVYSLRCTPLKLRRLGVVLRPCNLCSWKVEAGGRKSWVQDHPLILNHETLPLKAKQVNKYKIVCVTGILK